MAAELHVRHQLGLEAEHCADRRAAPGYSELLDGERQAALLRQAEQRAGAAAFWLLVETRVIAGRPAPVFWDLKAEDQAPYVQLARAIIQREKIAYEAGTRQSQQNEQTLDDAIAERDASEGRLEYALQHVEQLQEQVAKLEARLGVRQADAAFAAVDETLSHRCDQTGGAIIPERKAGAE